MARPRSDIAPRIVRAARDRFLAEGVDGAALRTIARHAGTSIGMIYYYFPTKDDLFLAVVEETYARVLARMERALEADAPFEERIRRLYRTIGALDDDEVATLRLVVREVLASSARLARLIDRFRRGHIPLVLGAIADGMREGALDAERHPIVLMMATFAVGFVPQMMWRFAGPRLALAEVTPPEAFADDLVRVLLHGAGAREAPKAKAAKPKSPARSRAPAAGRRTRAR